MDFHSYCFIDCVHIVYLDMLVATGERKVRRSRETCENFYVNLPLMKYNTTQIKHKKEILYNDLFSPPWGGVIFFAVSTVSLDIRIPYSHQKLSQFVHTSSERNALRWSV